MKLNLYFGTCAAICGATVFLHIFGGGPEFPDIALTSGLDDKQSSMYLVLWHAVTLLLSVATAAYAAAAYSSHFRPAALFFSIQFLAIAALFLIVGQTMLGNIWILPQWILFLAMVAIGLPGFRRQPRPSIHA